MYSKFAIFTVFLAILWRPPLALADARSDYLEAVEHQKAKRWGEAAQTFAKVTAQMPEHAASWKQLATCRYYLGDLEGAEASAQRYLKLQPQDQSFANWNAQLRKKLGLAPLDLSTPVPTPLATPVPVEGAITAAPAPWADAVEEAVVATARPERGMHFGLRLAGAYHFGLGSFEHGESVDSSTLPSGKGYAGKAAMGAGALAELTADQGGKLEFSLGVYPVLWDETQSSAQTDVLTRSNESHVTATLLPVLAGVGYRFDLSPQVRGLLSAGIGAIPSAAVELESQTVQTSLNGLTNTWQKVRADYAFAPAWRLALGFEVPIETHTAFYLGAQLLGAQFNEGSASYDQEVLDETGTQVSKVQGSSIKVSGLSVLSAGALGGIGIRF